MYACMGNRRLFSVQYCTFRFHTVPRDPDIATDAPPLSVSNVYNYNVFTAIQSHQINSGIVYIVRFTFVVLDLAYFMRFLCKFTINILCWVI